MFWVSVTRKFLFLISLFTICLTLQIVKMYSKFFILKRRYIILIPDENSIYISLFGVYSSIVKYSFNLSAFLFFEEQEWITRKRENSISIQRVLEEALFSHDKKVFLFIQAHRSIGFNGSWKWCSCHEWDRESTNGYGWIQQASYHFSNSTRVWFDVYQ